MRARFTTAAYTTPTHIITAEGTRFVLQGYGKRIAIRTALTLLAVIVTLFTIAAMIGMTQAAQAGVPAGEGTEIPTNCWVADDNRLACD